MAATRGPDHVVELLNPAAKALAGGRDLRGWSLRELVPEPLAGILDRVYETGQRHVASPRRPPAEIAAGAAEDRFFSVGVVP